MPLKFQKTGKLTKANSVIFGGMAYFGAAIPLQIGWFFCPWGFWGVFFDLNKWGVLTLARMVGGTYLRRIAQVQMGICLLLGGLNPCQDCLGHLCTVKMVIWQICSNLPAKWSECGAGGAIAIWTMPKKRCNFFSRASLTRRFWNYTLQVELNSM